MKKKLVATACLVLFFLNTLACTTFFLNKNGQSVFGRNYDWVTGTGMVHINSRGLSKYSIADNSLKWTSKYGSITFNQYGKENPTGGMNEKGLVIELMWLEGSEYPKPDERPAVGVLQWIQYNLDNAATVEEVIASDIKVRIKNEHSTPLHYLVADAKGSVATIEFLDGRMVAHTGKDLKFPVLTNSIYSESVRKTAPAISGNKDLPFTDNSLERFATACKMVNEYETIPKNVSPVDYAFQILGSVSQSNFTKWSIAYDITGRKIHFQTKEFGDRKTVDMNAFDFGCHQSHLAYNMNQKGSGDVSERFIRGSFALNKSIIEKAIQETGSRLSISREAVEASADLFRFSECFADAKNASHLLMSDNNNWRKNILLILALAFLALCVKPLILARNRSGF